MRALELAALCGLLVLSAARAEKPAEPQWSRNVNVVQAWLAPAEFSRPDFSLELPQLRVYDAKAQLLLDAAGYDRERFAPRLKALLQGGTKPVEGPAEAKELARITSADGKPLAALPPADFQIIEWWAEWCVPCHHQAADLAQTLAQLPGVQVNLVRVEAALPGMQKPKMIKIDDSQLTPEQEAKLLDPKTPQAEKTKILLKVQAKKGSPKPPG